MKRYEEGYINEHGDGGIRESEDGRFVKYEDMKRLLFYISVNLGRIRSRGTSEDTKEALTNAMEEAIDYARGGEQ